MPNYYDEKKKRNQVKPEDVPLGTGLAGKAKSLLEKRKEREREMNKRFGIKSKTNSNTNN